MGCVDYIRGCLACSSSYSSHTGSGYNLLCMPKSPNITDTFLYSHHDTSQDGGLLYGVQYETSSSGVSVLQSLHGYVVPCAACEATNNGVFTIPGMQHSIGRHVPMCSVAGGCCIDLHL